MDSAEEVALLVLNTLRIQNILAENKETGSIKIFLSDLHPESSKWVREFIGKEVVPDLIDKEQYRL